jgi:PTH1 family peptidyl-tRNA hydrolase
MKMIVGLGNPGRRYEGTAHNLGFEVADILARRWSLSFRESKRAKAEVAEGVIGNRPVVLVKPLTFMNLSGEAVAALTRQAEMAEDDLLVMTDDVSLPIGRLRIRPGGSHGGHNGLRSIVERLGHDRFARLRVGIRPSWEIEDLVQFVLSRLPPLERNQLGEMADLAADAAESWLREGAAVTAEKFNGLRRFVQEPERP